MPKTKLAVTLDAELVENLDHLVAARQFANLNPVRGSEQAGLRPVLILSHDVFNERSGTVIAVALTGQEPKAGFPLTLESGAAGLPKRSWIKISQIRTLAVECIGRRLSRASEEEFEKVIDGLNETISSP